LLACGVAWIGGQLARAERWDWRVADEISVRKQSC
jgi:hypothetical protein